MGTPKQVSTSVVLARIPKAQDLEVHVRRLNIDGVEVIELRDYIVSLKEYGRGYWVPANAAAVSELIKALQDALAL